MPDMPDKVLSLLGMARRAGKLALHEEANLSAIRSGRAKLLILAEDAGVSTEKKYLDKSAYYRVPLVRGISRRKLGEALGTADKTAVTLLDEGFAHRVQELLS